MEDWMYLIRDLGFPIAMVIWFMGIGNTTIKKNTEAMIQNKEAIIQNTEATKNLGELVKFSIRR